MKFSPDDDIRSFRAHSFSNMADNPIEHEQDVPLFSSTHGYANIFKAESAKEKKSPFYFSSSTGDDTGANVTSEFDFSVDKCTKDYSILSHLNEAYLKKIIRCLTHEYQPICQNAAAYLCHLTFCNADVKEKVAEYNGIQYLSALALSPDVESKRSSISVLRNLSHKPSLLIRHKINEASVVANLISVVGHFPGTTPEGAPLSSRVARDRTIESISATLCNLSTCDEFKEEIVKHGIFIIVQTILIPLCGLSDMGKGETGSYVCVEDNASNFELPMFIFATGTIRNVLDESAECRQRLRDTRGLIPALIHTMRTCVYNEDFGSKALENCICILRNLSFALQEIRDPAYLVRREAHFYAAVTNPLPLEKRIVFGGKKSDKKFVGLVLNVMDDSLNFNCLETSSYLATPRSTLNTVKGWQQLWDPSLMPIYISILTSSRVPVIQEAVVGVIQNLTACDWQPSAAIIKHFREEHGLPVLLELLRSENDHVVKSTATALRNLAKEEKSKKYIALCGMASLISRLPVLQNVPTHAVSFHPLPKLSKSGKCSRTVSLNTTSCLLAAIYTLVKEDLTSASFFVDCGGVPPCLAIAHTGLYEDPTATIPSDRDKTVRFARFLLRSLWNMKELQEGFKQSGWRPSNFCATDPLSELNTSFSSCMPIPGKRWRKIESKTDEDASKEETNENERKIEHTLNQMPDIIPKPISLPDRHALSECPKHSSFLSQHLFSFVSSPIESMAIPGNFKSDRNNLRLHHQSNIVYPTSFEGNEFQSFPATQMRMNRISTNNRLVVPGAEIRYGESQDDLASMASSELSRRSYIYRQNAPPIGRFSSSKSPSTSAPPANLY